MSQLNEQQLREQLVHYGRSCLCAASAAVVRAT